MKKEQKDNILISVFLILILFVLIYFLFIRKDDDVVIDTPQDDTSTITQPEPEQKPPVVQEQSEDKESNIELKLIGEDLVKIKEGSNYTDQGIKCTNNNEDCSKKVTTTNNIDNTRVGYYQYIYTYEYNNKKYTKTRIVEVTGDNYTVALSNTNYTDQDVTITLTSNISLEVFNYILDPSNKKYTNEKVDYKVSQNGEYIFKIYRKDNTYIEAKITITNINKPSQPQQPQQPQGGSSQGSEKPPKKPSNIYISYESDTLKYYIDKNDMGYVTYIWMKDPYNQIKTELGGNPSGLRVTSDILTSAVYTHNLGGKGLVGVNGSAFTNYNFQPELKKLDPNWEETAVTPIVIYDGKLVRNSTAPLSGTNDYFYVYGVTKNNELKYYNFWNYIQQYQSDELIKNIMEKDGVKYSFGFKTVLVENYQATYFGPTDAASRNAVCQIDNNNYALLDTPPMGFAEVANYLQSIGCKTALNLDGGGSQNLFYKKNDTGLQALYVTSRPVADALFFHEK